MTRLPAPPLLTENDIGALRYVAQGMSTGQVAAAMSVSTNTVRTRLRRIQRKLAVTGTGPAVARARQLDLV